MQNSKINFKKSKEGNNEDKSRKNEIENRKTADVINKSKSFLIALLNCNYLYNSPEVYDSVGFSIFTVLCNYDHD